MTLMLEEIRKLLEHQEQGCVVSFWENLMWVGYRCSCNNRKVLWYKEELGNQPPLVAEALKQHLPFDSFIESVPELESLRVKRLTRFERMV